MVLESIAWSGKFSPPLLSWMDVPVLLNAMPSTRCQCIMMPSSGRLKGRANLGRRNSQVRLDPLLCSHSHEL